MTEHEGMVEQIFARVSAALHELREAEQFEIMVVAPQEDSHTPCFYVLIDSASVLVHIGLWNERTFELGALDIQAEQVLFNYDLLVRDPADVQPYLEAVVQLLLSPAEVAAAPLALLPPLLA